MPDREGAETGTSQKTCLMQTKILPLTGAWAKNMRRTAIIIFFLLAMSGTAQARTILDTLIRVDTVLVTGRRIENDVVPAQVLTGRELQRLNTVSVADAIRYFSGVQIKDYGGIGGLKTVNIRSMGSQHVGVFYDGVQLGNAQNGQIDLMPRTGRSTSVVSLWTTWRRYRFTTARKVISSRALKISHRPGRYICTPGDRNSRRSGATICNCR